MKQGELLRHGAYGISIIVLLNRFIYLVAHGLHFSDIAKVIFFGVVGITALLLGLFRFHKGLSFGSVIGGVIAGRLALFYFHFKLTDLLQFIVALISLIVLIYAVYSLYLSQYSNKKGK